MATTLPYPTRDEVRAYLKVPVSVLSDTDLDLMLDTAKADQLARCTWGEDGNVDDPAAVPVSLVLAVYRRVQREVAARNLPLGMVGLEAEYGPAKIPTFDALVEHHEHAYRRVVLA